MTLLLLGFLQQSYLTDLQVRTAFVVGTRCVFSDLRVQSLLSELPLSKSHEKLITADQNIPAYF